MLWAEEFPLMVNQVQLVLVLHTILQPVSKLLFSGEIITFDQLALRAPTGKNTLMIQGKSYLFYYCILLYIVLIILLKFLFEIFF